MSNFKCQMGLEDKILILCGRTHLTHENRQELEQCLKSSVNFDLLTSRANQLQIPHLLYNALKNFPASVPTEFLERLKNGYFNNLGRSLKIFEEYKKLVKLFLSEGIETVPLKGPVFAEIVYGDMGLRPTSDIDVLVKDKDLERARQVLLKNGYAERGGTPEYNLEYARKYRIHMLFNKDFLLELHWNVCPPEKYKLPEEVLWEDVREYEIEGERIKGLSPEGMLVAQFYHALGSHFYKSLVDISELLKRYHNEIDWERLNKRVSSGNLRNAAVYFMRAAQDLLGAPGAGLDKVKPAITLRHIFAQALIKPEEMVLGYSDFRRQLLILLLVDNLPDVLFIMRYQLFRPKELRDLEAKYGC